MVDCMPHQWRRIETGLFLGLWLVLMLAGRTEMFRDPDTFWHTVVGQRILASGRIATVDAFSFTRAGQTWIPTEWLGECGMAALHRLGGWDALLTATAALLAGVYTAIGSRLLQAGLRVGPALLVPAIALAASSHQFHVRPLVCSLALLAWTFSLLVDVEAGRRPLVGLAWLVPVFVLWVNIHGGVLGGLGTVGIASAGWCGAFCAARGRPSAARSPGSAGDPGGIPAGADAAPRRPVRRGADLAGLALLLVVLAASVLANPFGLELPRAWGSILALPLPDLIQEHAPLRLSDTGGMAVLALAALYVVALAGVFPRWPRVTWLVPLVWLVLAFQRVRHAPLFAVVTVIALADLLPYTRWRAWLAARDMWRLPERLGAGLGLPGTGQAGATRLWPPRDGRLLAVAVVLSVLALEASGLHVPLVGRGWVVLDAALWPVELLPQLGKIGSQAEEARVFNDYRLGGFLIYHAPQVRVFIDGRCELYGRKFLVEYDRAERENPAEIEIWRQRYGFGHALVARGSPFDRHLAQDPQWTLVGRTSTAALYGRVQGSGVGVRGSGFGVRGSGFGVQTSDP
jgi:hypothetical protein